MPDQYTRQFLTPCAEARDARALHADETKRHLVSATWEGAPKQLRCQLSPSGTPRGPRGSGGILHHDDRNTQPRRPPRVSTRTHRHGHSATDTPPRTIRHGTYRAPLATPHGTLGGPAPSASPSSTRVWSCPLAFSGRPTKLSHTQRRHKTPLLIRLYTPRRGACFVCLSVFLTHT